MADPKSPPEPQAGDPLYAEDDASLLTEKEKSEIRTKLRAKLREDQKKDARTRFMEQEERRLKYEEGMTVGGVEDDMVNITLDLADHSGEISINGRKYFHGHVYTVARHIARTLSEIQMRGWDHENEVKSGKSRLHNMQNRHNSKVSPVGIFNPPRMSMA